MTRPRRGGSRLLVPLLQSGIRVYQWTLSPLLGPACRFEPTCSVYASQAIETHGPLRGIQLGLRRFSRCHPFGGHGYDPVPHRGSRE